MVTDKLVLSVCTYNKCSKRRPFTHTRAQSVCFRLNTSLSTASMLVAVRSVLGLSCYRSSLFQMLNKVVQRVFFHPLAGNLFISLTAP